MDEVWEAPEMPELRFSGPVEVLPSVYGVTKLAAATVAAACGAVEEVCALRSGTSPRPVWTDTRHAAALFRSERLLEPIGWRLPPLWDALAGDYRTSDGWILLHTNAAHHRRAALDVLGCPPERSRVADAVAEREAFELEAAITDAGGCAAMLRSPEEWGAHAQRSAVAAQSDIEVHAWEAPSTELGPLPAGVPPLQGLRVLDLTRVVAGPVCGRFLGWAGADVTRVDPPHIEDSLTLVVDTSAGKRRVVLDLADPAGRARMDRLVRDAHVVLCGYRPGALASLGYSPDRLRELNPAVIVASLDAYGGTGPWGARRGFDSMVQRSTGIAHRQQEVVGASAPVPLPAQALDHATGYLMATAVVRSVAQQQRRAMTSEIHCSLAATATTLVARGETGDPDCPEPTAEEVAPWLEEASTPWGRVRRVRPPDGLVS